VIAVTGYWLSFALRATSQSSTVASAVMITVASYWLSFALPTTKASMDAAWCCLALLEFCFVG
jgi:hypothetical protein